MAWVTGGIGTI